MNYFYFQFSPCSNSIVVFCPIGLLYPTKPAEDVIITTKGLQARTQQLKGMMVKTENEGYSKF